LRQPFTIQADQHTNQTFHGKKQKKWEANKPRKRLYFFFAAFFLVFLAALGTILTSKQ
jgi:hypothetical protein